MRISQESIEEVRETANILEVASEFTALRRQGTNLIGLCPYPDHTEKTPSFSVSPEKNFCYCFGCGRGGDTIKLVMELKSFSFVEAVSHLAERSGVELKFEGRSSEEEKKAGQRAARRRSARKALAAAAAYYHKYLLKSPAADEGRRYLEGRGMEYSTIEEFRLGYAAARGRPGFLQAAGKVGLGREALEDAGLLSTRGGERFVDRVMFPISDKRGRIIGFGARSLGDAKPKYLNSPETEIFNKRSLLYGFPQVAEAIRKEKAALVVEGYTDVLMLYQSGIKNAVATLGTAMTEQHLKSLSMHADVIYLLFDPDEAGEKAIQRAESAAQLTLAATELNAYLSILRLTEDPADWISKHSVEEFRSLTAAAVPILEYSIRLLAEQARGADAITRQKVMPQLLQYLHKIRIQAPVLEWEARRLASDALQIRPQNLEDLLKAEVAKHQAGAGGDGSPEMAVSSRPHNRSNSAVSSDPLTEAGRELLALVLACPDLAACPLREGMTAPALVEGPVVLEAKDFGDEEHARIFALLLEHAGEDLGTVLFDERARPLLNEVSALQAVGEKLYPSAASLRAAWFRLAALSREKAKLSTNDFDEKYRLHVQIKNLNEAAVEASNLTLES